MELKQDRINSSIIIQTLFHRWIECQYRRVPPEPIKIEMMKNFSAGAQAVVQVLKAAVDLPEEQMLTILKGIEKECESYGIKMFCQLSEDQIEVH